MFDIDSGKLLIVAVLALIVIGPKELPRVLRQVGQAVGKMRRMASEFQGQFMDAMKEADIADIRKELDDLNKTAALDVQFNPMRDIQAELTGAMAPIGSTSSEAIVSSPAEGFALPPVDVSAHEDTMAEGLAPVVDMSTADDEADVLPETLNGAAGLVEVPAKRKIFVKRRRSSFSIVQGNAKALSTGEPLAVRQRIVRPKALEPQGVQTS